MKRSAPMKRTPFKRKPPTPAAIERAPRQLYQLARPCRTAVISTTAVPVQKLTLVRSEAYRRLVASMPCILCGIEGFTQHAHGNMGKGMALKTCDLFAFPLCCTRPGEIGCHAKLDQGALFAKAARRTVEMEWARRTVLAIVAAGLFPPALAVPDWAAP